MWSWLLILYCIYVPIFMFLWIIEICIIIFHIREFQSSYYFFFILCGIVSLISEVVINIGTRLPLFPEINAFYLGWTGTFPMLLYACGHFFGAFHEFNNIFTAINRATAIITPNSHDSIWKYGIPISCVLMFLAGASGSWHLFDTPTYFVPISINGSNYIIMAADDSKHPEVSNALNGVIVSIVSPCISVSLYLTAICFLRKKWKLKIIRTEASLMLLGISSMFLCLPITFQQLHFVVNIKKLDKEGALALFQMLPWLFDLRFLSPTVLILVTDSNMRGKFKRLFTFWKEKDVLSSNQNTISHHQSGSSRKNNDNSRF